MSVARRVYWSFLGGLLALTFSGAQSWDFVLALRRGYSGWGQTVLGIASILLLAASAVVVLRILYVTAHQRRQQ